MEEKILLGQFAAKIAKSKIVYDSTKGYVDRLNQEALRLEKEYDQLVEERKAAESHQGSLKMNYNILKKQNNEDATKFSQEMERLNSLKNEKKKLKKQKDSVDHDLLKNTLYFEELVKQREQLQYQAKQLSGRLEGITSEKGILKEEYDNTQEAIEGYSEKIRGLKKEIENMKGIITASTVHP